MKVFIDTNILLDIYHLSGPDLDELLKLVKVVSKGKVELLVSEQVIDEFWRNRERVIADAMRSFRETRANAKIPNIIRTYPEWKELREAVDKVNDVAKSLAAKASADIEADSLKADAVLTQLFAAITVGAVSENVITRAKHRVALGNPPGKPESIGDAVNWEWLLKQEINFWDDRLVIVSADNDFESELHKGRPREYLLREWNRQNPDCKLILQKSLAAFLEAEFPDIKLAEDLDKLEAIENLEESGSFVSTHSAVAKLLEYDDFKDWEVKRLLSACLENNQVKWILTDADVAELAKKIIASAKSADALKLVAAVQPLLPSEDEGDIPF